MAVWLQYLVSFAALLVLAPLVALLAHRFGGRAKGGLMLASVLLGFGAVLDQPAKHAIEAAEPVKGSPENDEPPLADDPHSRDDDVAVALGPHDPPSR